MNRRRFLELLGMAAAGTGIVYSFPSVIVPLNVAETGLTLSASPVEMANWIDFFQQQLVCSRDWFSVNPPPWRDPYGPYIHKQAPRLPVKHIDTLDPLRVSPRL